LLTEHLAPPVTLTLPEPMMSTSAARLACALIPPAPAIEILRFST
jgi:hypothetical protein